MFKSIKYFPFVILLLSGACTVSGNEELILEDTAGIEAIYTDTVTINTSVVSLGPIKTNAPAYLLFGNYKDQDIGMIAAKAFTQVRYASGTVGSNAVFDSLMLHMDIGYKYGNFTKPQSLYVYALTESLLNRDYLVSEETSYNATPLNEQVHFIPLPIDIPYVGIRMKDVLGRSLFQKIKSNASDLASQENFNAYFPGLVFGPGPDNNALFGLNTNSGKTKLSVYYHEEGSKTAAAVDFLVVNSNVQYNQITYQYLNGSLGSLLPGIELSTSNLNNKAYITAGSGLVTKLTFPYLDKFAELPGDIAINKAELLIENVNDYNEYAPPINTFFLLETDQSNKMLYYVDPDENTNPDGDSVVRGVQINLPHYTSGYTNKLTFSYNKDLNNYSAPLTYYLEAMINQKKENNGLLLYPAGMGSTVNNLIFGDKSSPGKKLKLKIYYSILNNTTSR